DRPALFNQCPVEVNIASAAKAKDPVILIASLILARDGLSADQTGQLFTCSDAATIRLAIAMTALTRFRCVYAFEADALTIQLDCVTVEDFHPAAQLLAGRADRDSTGMNIAA